MDRHYNTPRAGYPAFSQSNWARPAELLIPWCRKPYRKMRSKMSETNLSSHYPGDSRLVLRSRATCWRTVASIGPVRLSCSCAVINRRGKQVSVAVSTTDSMPYNTAVPFFISLNSMNYFANTTDKVSTIPSTGLITLDC